MNPVEQQPAAVTTEAVAHPLRVLGWVPLIVSLETSLRHFTVRDLSCLAPGTIVRATIAPNAAIPLQVNGKLIAWAKLDVVGDRLAARITELI